ncbi:MAG: copper resistance protein CopC [Actinobacteria bacterium]|nr:copper resistance protein CopC [Actinomycetota bacterium]
MAPVGTSTVERVRLLHLPGRFTAALLLAAALVLGTWGWMSSPAVAHDQLISSIPEDGGTLTELPTQIVLEFNNELIDAAPALLIRDAASTTVHQATPAVDGRFATTEFPELGDGSYRIAWSVVSSDGHRIEGSMPFEMATGRPAAPLATSAPSAAGGETTSGTEGGNGDEGLDGDTIGDDGLAGLSTPVKVAIGIGSVGAVAAAAAVVLRRGRGGLRGQ